VPALSKVELSEAMISLFEELSEGNTDASIMDLMGWNADTFQNVKRAMLEGKAEELRTKPREHVYVEYLISQSRNIQDLNDLVDTLDKKQQYNALVGAIRLRSDIHDKIIARGQEFGVIRKEAETKRIIGGLLVTDMSSSEIRTAIGTHLGELKGMMERFGDADFASMPTPKKLHHGAAVPVVSTAVVVEDKPKPEGKVKAKTSRRSGGRVRSREARDG
jgi:hypothetical protein